MAYDPTSERTILFGGAHGGFLVLVGGGPLRQKYTAETRVYDPRANTWSLGS